MIYFCLTILLICRLTAREFSSKLFINAEANASEFLEYRKNVSFSL